MLRQGVVALAAALAALAVAGCGGEDGDEPAEGAQNVVLALIAERGEYSDEAASLTLRGVPARASRFIVEPVRFADSLPTAELAEGYDTVFGEETPAAVLTLADGSAFEMSLESPSHRESGGELRFEAESAGRGAPPSRFGSATLVLEATSRGYGIIAGRVVGSAGGPIPGATVVADAGGPSGRAATSTAPDGRFALFLTRPGQYRMEARAGRSVTKGTGIAIRPGETAEIDFTLPSGG